MTRPVRVKINDKAFWSYSNQENVSQNELAKKLGISSGYLSQLVNGHRFPSPKLRQKMLQYFRLNFNDLFILDSGAKVNNK